MPRAPCPLPGWTGVSGGRDLVSPLLLSRSLRAMLIRLQCVHLASGLARPGHAETGPLVPHFPLRVSKLFLQFHVGSPGRSVLYADILYTVDFQLCGVDS